MTGIRPEYKSRWETYSYRNHTPDDRIDPVSLVGGDLDNVSKRQLEMVQSVGLKPTHKYLDIGCGCVRGGRLIEKYLDEGNYWGLDISETLLEEGKKHVKCPDQLIQVTDYEYTKYVSLKFDYIVLFSVFTHIYEDDIVNVLNGIKPLTTPTTITAPSVLLMSEDNERDALGNVDKIVYKQSCIERIFNSCGYDYKLYSFPITNTRKHTWYLLNYDK